MPFDGATISNLPPDAEIARLNSRRCDPRWEGFKGFIKGALPALVLGGLAGVLIGASSVVGLSLFTGVFSGTAAPGIFAVGGVIASAVAGFSALVSGTMGASREVREAHMKNYAIDRAIQIVHQNALSGIPPQALPEEQQEISRSRFVDKILSRGREATPAAFVERLQRQVAEQREGGVKLH